MLIYKFF